LLDSLLQENKNELIGRPDKHEGDCSLDTPD